MWHREIANEKIVHHYQRRQSQDQSPWAHHSSQHQSITLNSIIYILFLASKNTVSFLVLVIFVPIFPSKHWHVQPMQSHMFPFLIICTDLHDSCTAPLLISISTSIFISVGLSSFFRKGLMTNSMSHAFEKCRIHKVEPPLSISLIQSSNLHCPCLHPPQLPPRDSRFGWSAKLSHQCFAEQDSCVWFTWLLVSMRQLPKLPKPVKIA